MYLHNQGILIPYHRHSLFHIVCATVHISHATWSARNTETITTHTHMGLLLPVCVCGHTDTKVCTQPLSHQMHSLTLQKPYPQIKSLIYSVTPDVVFIAHTHIYYGIYFL